MIAAEALRTGLATGPALAAFLGLVLFGSSRPDGDFGRAVTGRAAALGLLGPLDRPNERKDKKALTGLCASSGYCVAWETFDARAWFLFEKSSCAEAAR